MPIRQQRSNNARGTLPAGVSAYAPEVTWTIANVGVSTIDLELSVPSPNLVIAGVPQFVRSFGNAVPASVERFYNRLRLVYADANPIGFSLTLGNRDAGVRTSIGGYLAPGVQIRNGPSQTDVAIIVDNADMLAQVSVYQAPLAGTCYLPTPDDVGTTKWMVVDLSSSGPVYVTYGVGGPTIRPVAAGEIARFVFQADAWVYAP